MRAGDGLNKKNVDALWDGDRGVDVSQRRPYGALSTLLASLRQIPLPTWPRVQYNMRRHLSIRCRYLDRDRLLLTRVFRVMTLFAYSCCIRRNDQTFFAPPDRHWRMVGYGYDGGAG